VPDKEDNTYTLTVSTTQMSSQQVVSVSIRQVFRDGDELLRDPTLTSESLLAYFHREAVSSERITASKKGANIIRKYVR